MGVCIRGTGVGLQLHVVGCLVYFLVFCLFTGLMLLLGVLMVFWLVCCDIEVEFADFWFGCLMLLELIVVLV